MLTSEANEHLTRVGAGTPAGELLRRYWYPVAAVSEMARVRTKFVRLLGEELVLFKSRDGQLGLIAAYCAHRGVNLVYGMVEADGLRCPYHGWKFGTAGQCLEQPFEEAVRPDGTFRDRVRLPSYPVEELGGLVFAYLGPQPAPLVPRWDSLVQENAWREIGFALTECNWLQSVENVLDPVHVEWLHGEFTNYAADESGTTVRRKERAYHQKIGFTSFEYGIMKRRLLAGESEDADDWTTGHPFVFPSIQKGGDMLRLRVPVDDTHTAQWYYVTHTAQGSEQRAQDIPLFEMPSPRLDAYGRPRWDLLNGDVDPQDNAIFAAQRPILDRTAEMLGESDTGIILFRKLLEEQIRIVQQGGTPMNVFTDPATNVSLNLEIERPGTHMAGRGALGIGHDRRLFSERYSVIAGQPPSDRTP